LNINSGNIKIVDSHCHLDCLDLKAFKGVSKDLENPDLSDVINHAKTNDVAHMLCVCIDLEHFDDVLSIAKKYPFISASVGKHPTDKEGFEPNVHDLVKHVNDNPEVIAIGETGLDYFHGTPADIKNQKERFDTHIEASIETNKPLIIHSRDAKEDTLSFLAKSSSKGANGVFHCFTGDYEMAKAGIDLGFYISFTGIITFKNALDLQEVVKKLPLDALLIETDSPYLAPVPYRGKPNYPGYVKEVALKVAELKGISYEQVAEQTTQNFLNCFKLDKLVRA
jgi:TatD DNase family protein